MARALLLAGAALIAAALALGAYLLWRLRKPVLDVESGEAAAVVVQFNWVYALGAIGVLLVTVGLLSRMRRQRRPRL